jgi:hypothetical protein
MNVRMKGATKDTRIKKRNVEERQQVMSRPLLYYLCIMSQSDSQFTIIIQSNLLN